MEVGSWKLEVGRVEGLKDVRIERLKDGRWELEDGRIEGIGLYF